MIRIRITSSRLKSAAAGLAVVLFASLWGFLPALAQENQPVPHAWFNFEKINLLVLTVLLASAILGLTFIAGRGREFYIRKIAGIAAIEEAVGRATEMGKPVLFVAGTQDMDNVQTVSGLTILSSVAQKTAEYETTLVVPTSRSIVMATGREVVKQSYQAAGRPELYNDDMVYYVTDEQFGYVAALDGLMLRDKPAACFYLGAFFAESLILAETGNSIGAIQVAGTAMPTQLPFFVAACDYTLIGEELFAASAYLSKDLRMLGSLRGQDMGKALGMIAIVIGITLLTADALAGNATLHAIAAGFQRLFAINF
jgi:Domain of unknown function (DUF6754)